MCHAGEGGERLSSGPRPGALGDLAGNHRWPQGAFGAIVGRLDAWIIKEAQQVAPLVVPAQLVQEALIVGVRQYPLPQLLVQQLAEAAGLRGEVRRRPSVVTLPEGQRLIEQSAEPQAKGPPAAPFRLPWTDSRGGP